MHRNPRGEPRLDVNLRRHDGAVPRHDEHVVERQTGGDEFVGKRCGEFVIHGGGLEYQEGVVELDFVLFTCMWPNFKVPANRRRGRPEAC